LTRFTLLATFHLHRFHIVGDTKSYELALHLIDMSDKTYLE
jgi:hypothetical protein